MIRIAEEIWEYWRAAQERFVAEAIDLFFSSSVSEAQALEALRTAAREAVGELVSRAPTGPGGEEFSPGFVSFTPAPGGVVMRVDEWPEDLETLLRAIAARLETAGVAGRFELYGPTVRPIPPRADLLECRLRLRGERFHYRGQNHGSRADEDALTRAIDEGVHWCVANAPQAPLSLTVSLLKPVVLQADDDLADYVRKGVDQTDVGVVRLASVGEERFRILAVHAHTGRASLIEGGETFERHGWQASLQSFREMLLGAAAWAVYGFIKRGSRPEAASLGNSLADDWVPMPHREWPGWGGGEEFENELAPDVFGVQMLGDGYSRVPDGPDWLVTLVEGGGALVEHRDPEAWFGRPFGPFGGHRTTPTDPALIPEIVSRARDDFADILFTDDVARNHSRCPATPES